MKYTKPEVAVLGQAAQVIELMNPPKLGSPTDGAAGSSHATNPAYDLDE
jgi:hypothetical protein